MPDQQRLFDVLTRFSRTLVGHYDVSDVLYELSDGVVQVIGAAGAGVSLGDDMGHLRFATATSERVTVVENVQQDSQEGACHVAFASGEPVFVADLASTDAWPALRDACLSAGLLAVAGIPMARADATIGSLDIYDDRVRDWTPQDLAAARVLADIATGYVAHASELDRVLRMNEQLQSALESRVVIEQAKGILAGERGISVDQAFTVLRGHARSRNVTVRSIAQAVVELGLRP